MPALSTLTVFFDPAQLSRDRLAAEIEALLETQAAGPDRGRGFDIPVAYGGAGGPDLGEMAARAGLSAAAAIALHAGQLYQVYMLGFLPGFAYLGDLAPLLRLPRRHTPRIRVPAGSVAIAADMTAVYPLESPGGWHLIGYSPVVLWDMSREREPLLQPGDTVRFVPVSSQEASELRRRAAEGWRPEPWEAP